MKTPETTEAALCRLQQKAREDANLFEELLDTVWVCSLGQVTEALFESLPRT